MAATRQRILEATYLCVSRSGLAKTTVEDAARQAGVSRATIYRHFPGGRDELLHALITWEFLEFFARLYDVVCDAPTLEEMLERGIAFAHRAIRGHEVLQRVLQTEPGSVLPTLTVESNRIRSVIADFLAPHLHQHGLIEGVEMDEATDFLARMILSTMSSPGRWDLDDPEQVARLVRGELLAGIVVSPPAAS